MNHLNHTSNLLKYKHFTNLITSRVNCNKFAHNLYISPSRIYLWSSQSYFKVYFPFYFPSFPGSPPSLCFSNGGNIASIPTETYKISRVFPGVMSPSWWRQTGGLRPVLYPSHLFVEVFPNRPSSTPVGPRSGSPQDRGQMSSGPLAGSLQGSGLNPVPRVKKGDLGLGGQSRVSRVSKERLRPI